LGRRILLPDLLPDASVVPDLRAVSSTGRLLADCAVEAREARVHVLDLGILDLTRAAIRIGGVWRIQARAIKRVSAGLPYARARRV
jgi:hypothetical protein